MKPTEVKAAKLFVAFILLLNAILRSLPLINYDERYFSIWHVIPFHLYIPGLFFLIWAFVPGKKSGRRKGNYKKTHS